MSSCCRITVARRVRVVLLGCAGNGKCFGLRPKKKKPQTRTRHKRRGVPCSADEHAALIAQDGGEQLVVPRTPDPNDERTRLQADSQMASARSERASAPNRTYSCIPFERSLERMRHLTGNGVVVIFPIFGWLHAAQNSTADVPTIGQPTTRGACGQIRSGVPGIRFFF